MTKKNQKNSNKMKRMNYIPAELEAKFTELRRRIKRLTLIKGTALAVFSLMISFLIAILLDRLFYLKSPFRLLILIASLTTLVTLFILYLIIPLVRKYSSRKLALSIEDKFPSLSDNLTSTVELSEELDADEVYTSKELIKALTDDTMAKTRSINFKSIVPLSAIRKALIIAIFLVAVASVYCIVQPLIAKNVFARIVSPYSDTKPFTYTKLKVKPGSIPIAKGTNVVVKGIASGKIPEKAILYWKYRGRKWSREILKREKKDTFSYEFKSILRPIYYKIYAGDARSGTYTIIPTETPAVVGIKITYIYPEYTRLRTAVSTDNNGTIAAVKGSRVRITATTNKKVKSAEIVFDEKEQKKLKIRGKQIISDFFEIEKDGTYFFRLVDYNGFKNRNPAIYSIKALDDQAPTINIFKPDKYSDSTADGVVTIEFRASDDFGIEKIGLHYLIKSGEKKEQKDRLPEDEMNGSIPMKLESQGKKELAAQYFLDISQFSLTTSNLLSFYLEAADNDTLNGPNIGKSVVHTIRIISDEDSFRKIENEQLDLQHRLRKLIKKQKENKKIVDVLREFIKKIGVFPQQQENQLSTAKSEQKNIEETGKELAEDFESTVRKMQENPMIELRTVMRMNDMKEMLKNLAENEMVKASEELKAAESIKDPKGKYSQLQQASQTQQKIIDTLEEIDKQFAKLQDEQKLLSLAATARELAKEQDKNIDSTKAARQDLEGLFAEDMNKEQKRRLKKLVDEENKLKEKTDDFEERLHRTLKQMEYQKSDDAKYLENALQKFKEDNITEDIKNAINELRANHLNIGMNYQKKISKNLWQIAKNLEEAQMARLQGEFKNMPERMTEQISEIDKLIEIEQQIIEKTKPLPKGTAEDPIATEKLKDFDNVAKEQNDLARRTDSFREVLEEIFDNLVMIGINPVTPLKKATGSMESAGDNLGKLMADNALKYENLALAELEKAREELARALAKLLAEANFAQMMQGLSLLDEMIEKQKKINDDTIEIDKEIKRKEQLLDSVLRMLMLLSRQQDRLGKQAKSLEIFLKRMGKVSEMMGDVSIRLKDAKTGIKTQQIQGEILQLLMQMLAQLQMQCQKMCQAMGMSGMMAGRAGTGNRSGLNLPSILKEFPGGVTSGEWAKLPPQLKRELLQAWTEKYPAEFRELLRLYYMRLSDEENPY